MCTASWTRTAGGYELFFNRDESRLRSYARPPSIWEVGGSTFLAPRDADAGGTWIAAGVSGVSLCLLNRYQDAYQPVGKPISRGLLVAELASAPSAHDVLERLASAQLRSYRPFTLLVLELPGLSWAVSWDGLRLTEPACDPTRPLTSSSADPDRVAEARRELWLETVAGDDAQSDAAADVVAAFHHSHRPTKGPLSPCMHRFVASTVSFTHVRMMPEEVSMAYADGPPCTTAVSPPVILRR